MIAFRSFRNVRRIFPSVVLLVCALLPLHPLMHDHVDFHGSQQTAFDGAGDEHRLAHDHPIVGATPARVMSHVCVAAIFADAARGIAASTRIDRHERSLGGVRSDNDVGWHVVLSTFIV